MLKFSKENNAKLDSIKEWSEIENPKVYSISLLSGFSCSFASDCQTYAIENKITKDYQGRPSKLFARQQDVLDTLFEYLVSPKGYWKCRVVYYID